MVDRLRLLTSAAEQTLECASAWDVSGVVAIGAASIDAKSRFDLQMVALGSQMVRTKLRDERDLGTNYAGVATAKMMRRARRELGLDDSDLPRTGELYFRGDAAFHLHDVVYLATFSGSTEKVDMRLANFGVTALWLELYYESKRVGENIPPIR